MCLPSLQNQIEFNAAKFNLSVRSECAPTVCSRDAQSLFSQRLTGTSG